MKSHFPSHIFSAVRISGSPADIEGTGRHEILKSELGSKDGWVYFLLWSVYMGEHI